MDEMRAGLGVLLRLVDQRSSLWFVYLLPCSLLGVDSAWIYNYRWTLFPPSPLASDDSGVLIGLL